MRDIFACLVMVLGLFGALNVTFRWFEPWERKWLGMGLLAHAGAAIAHVLVVQNVLGGGDMLGYHRFGELLSAMLRESPAEVSWLLVQEVFQQETALFPPTMVRGSTGSMFAISGFLVFLANDSLWATCILVSGISFFGRLALYRVFRSELAPAQQRLALIGCLFVPSVMFWTSGLVKEAIATGGLGFFVFGGYVLAARRWSLRGLSSLTWGACTIAVVKPYLLLPAGIAAGLWLFFDGHRPPELRRRRTVRVGSAILGAALAIVALIGVGRVFPRFEVASLAEHAAQMQELVDVTHGGSDYELEGARDATFGGQLALMPLALATALFRPTVVEASSPQIAVAALETLAGSLLLLWAVLSRGPRAAARQIRSEPLLIFSIVLALGVAVGVGLGTTNLGSLSRYRAPMMPFYAVTLLVLTWSKRPAAQTSHVAHVRGITGSL